MSPAEISDLLAFAGGYGLPAPERPDSWHHALYQLDLDEAMAAVVAHYQESTSQIMPADIWNRCRVPEAPVAPVIPLRPRMAPDPDRWHRMWEAALTEAAAASESRRALVLGSKPPEDDDTPPLSARLLAEPLGYAYASQWAGFIPPEMFNGNRNDSRRRAALLALVEDALALDAEAGQ
jgi:hypothetical protein